MRLKRKYDSQQNEKVQQKSMQHARKDSTAINTKSGVSRGVFIAVA
jgi:hypothetical protein